nr:MAG TPA: hypothetical protein [Caudoviricetes sp.]
MLLKPVCSTISLSREIGVECCDSNTRHYFSF